MATLGSDLPRFSIQLLHSLLSDIASMVVQHHSRDLRVWLAIVGLAYLCFVIYGSLVPLSFRPMPLAGALDAFSRIAYLDLGIGSRADWVANILLFIPLTYLWTGVLEAPRPGAMRVLVAIVVFASALGLSILVEFTQLFFPPRTVSINDILAEAIGAAIGISIWWLTGKWLMHWLRSLPLAQGSRGVAERLLTVYLLLVFGYNVMPLDLTLSPVELYHKWREGRVLLVPFSAAYANLAQQVYDLLSDTVVWVPVAMLWAYAYKTSTRKIWWYVLFAAMTLEFLQLFVYSRVSDSTDILTAGIGGAIGLWIARARQKSAPQRETSTGRGVHSSTGRLPWLAVVVWLAVVLTVFWYPFDFSFDRDFVRSRLLESRRAPFEALYFGTEFRALTEVLHKAGFMLPLGVLLGYIFNNGTRRLPRGLVHAAAILVVVIVAASIEAGQLFLPGKIADLTDVLLESAGAIAGYFVGVAAVSASRRPLPAQDHAALPGLKMRSRTSSDDRHG